MTYTPQELVVAAAAREIGDGEVVFVGMRLPLLAFALAKRTPAPRAVGLCENGMGRAERAGPMALITTLGVIRFDAQSKEAYLASFHPHTSVAEILESTGWPLRVGANAGATPAPTDEELRVIRELDPEGFWTK